jgi:hypothetical protein
MHLSRRAALAAPAVAMLLLAGCTSHSVTGSAPSGQPAPPTGSTGAAAQAPAPGVIPVGPGPQRTYTVQEQPPAGSCHYGSDKGEPLEDRTCTPGATSPAVTQATLDTTICRKGGYTKGIRPPASVTGAEKRANAASYGYTGSLSVAEYDHLVSLELGGDPNDRRNLWVEPPAPGHVGTSVNNKKDPVESKLHTAVCAHTVSLAAAQQAIVQDWTTALSRLGIG